MPVNKLYERDFSKLSEEESAVLSKIQDLYKDDGNQFSIRLNRKKEELLESKTALWYYKSLFPNHVVFPSNLEENLEEEINKIYDDFKEIVFSPETIERDVLKFIKSRRAWFIPVSIGKNYSNWGHHQLYIIPEFPLGTNYKVDYLIIGKNSEGYHFMFVEFEGVNAPSTLKDGSFSAVLQKGIKQINDWKYWLQKNYSSLKPIFEKYKNEKATFPEEFYELDMSRLSFCLVCGRRKDYSKRSYQDRRNLLIENRIALLHFDNLLDEALDLLTYRTYGGKNLITNNIYGRK